MEKYHHRNTSKLEGGSDTNPVFSKQNIQEDYIHLDGIKNRTGVTKDNLPALVVKEFVDNALDYVETFGVKDPWVNIAITREKQFLRIVVRNPVNPNTDYVFSKEMLGSIYNFRTYYSSKRVHKIHRGALGDASKLVLGIPYALADSMGIPHINLPLTIRTNINNTLQTFHVGLSSIDRQAEIIEDKITPSSSSENYTEVENILPLSEDKNEQDGITALLLIFLIHYTFLNTHIEFTFKIDGYNQVRLPATESTINSGKNISSIHYDDLSEFRRFIKNLDDDTQIIYDVLGKTYRETTSLPKKKLIQMTVGELKSSIDAIDEIYNQLHDAMPPVSRQKGLSSFLPFDTNKKYRKSVLEERLSQAGILCKLVKYKQMHGYHALVSKDGSQVEYPYFVEVLIAHSSQEYVHSNLRVIQAINSTIAPNKNTDLFGRTLWYNVGNEGGGYKDVSLFEVLDHYGYKFESKGCKKPNSIVIVNLVSPKIHYNNFSKSQIDTSPFADSISEVLDKVCKGGIDKDGKISQLAGLRKILEERKASYLLLQDPVAKRKALWTQSDVFYATRKLLINEHGYTDQEINRDHITASIRDECEKLGVTREEIGVHAADRAQLYFKGKWSDVGLDEIDEQVDYGTDMIIIEKEGVITQIGLFANKKGIALLNTRGFAVEYASKLAKLADERGCNISILVDFDVSGLLIFMKLRKIIPNIKRIGVDFKTLEDLKLDVKDVEEEYEAPEKHLKPLEAALRNALEEESRDCGEEDKAIEYSWIISQLEYLKTKRIEINSITKELDDNSAFWDWIVEELRGLFPYRDFNRSVDIPVYVVPEPLQELNDMIEEKGKVILKDRREKLQDQLSNNILPDYSIKDYEAAIAEQSRRIIESDPDVKAKLEEIEKLLPQPQPSKEGGS